jgi:L-fucose mutarotase
VLRFPLIHPPLLAALGAAGHGGKVLLADANYSHSTNVSPAATVIHLNCGPAW